MDFSKGNIKTYNELLNKAEVVAEDKHIAAAEIDFGRLEVFGSTKRFHKLDRQFTVSQYPSETGEKINPFNGEFFELRHWPLRMKIEKHEILREIAEYEAKLINEN